MMRSLSLVGLVFFASGLLGFCESGKSEDVSVFKEMLREFQDRVFNKFDHEVREIREKMDSEIREIKERLANKADKVFE